MEGFRKHFGWDCPSDVSNCIPASSREISTDKGLINGLFGAGAAMYVQSGHHEMNTNLNKEFA